MGPPGAGKGTQANLLQQRFGYKHISTGDLLRQNVRDETKLGLAIKKYMDKAQMAPDELVIQLALDALPSSGGWILDGFPRTLDQAVLLQEKAAPEIVIYISPSDEEIMTRIMGRVQCTGGHVYHLTNNPPIKQGICDVDGLELFHRQDDNSEGLAERLKSYRLFTKPLTDYYRNNSLLWEAPDSTIEDVHQAIVQKINAANHIAEDEMVSEGGPVF